VYIEPTNVDVWVAVVVFAAISLAFILAFIRLVLGPSLADRIVALDLVAYLAVAYMVAYAVITDEMFFLDPALVLALIAFVGTIAFARYIEHRAEEDDAPRTETAVTHD